MKNGEDGGTTVTVVTSLLEAFAGMYKSSYAGSKAPVEQFTKGVVKELSSRIMSVNAVALGPIDTRKLVTCSSIVVTNAHSAFFYRQESPEAAEFHKNTGVVFVSLLLSRRQYTRSRNFSVNAFNKTCWKLVSGYDPKGSLLPVYLRCFHRRRVASHGVRHQGR